MPPDADQNRTELTEPAVPYHTICADVTNIPNQILYAVILARFDNKRLILIEKQPM